MVRRLALAALVAAMVAIPGCSTGRDAVDPGGGGRQRFVAGEGTARVLAAGDRKPAPAVTGELLDGGRFDLASRRGQVVVLNFWASWCAPCRVETPDLQALSTALERDGVTFVGVNVKDDRDKAKAFQQGFGMTYPSLWDPASRVALQFRDLPPTAIPVTIVIDRPGRVAALFLRAVLRDELEPVLRQIAAEPR